MSVSARVLTAAATLTLVGGVAAVVFTSSGGAATAPIAARTVAAVSVQTVQHPATIACYFELDSSGKVVSPPALQAFDTNPNDKETCVIQIGSHGTSNFVRVITPRYPLGKFSVGNGTYLLSVGSKALLRGSYPLDGQPKHGYNLACQIDRGNLVPARPGLYGPVHDCKAFGRHFAINAEGVGIELTLGGRVTILRVGPLRHPGHLVLATLRPAA